MLSLFIAAYVAVTCYADKFPITYQPVPRECRRSYMNRLDSNFKTTDCGQAIIAMDPQAADVNNGPPFGESGKRPDPRKVFPLHVINDFLKPFKTGSISYLIPERVLTCRLFLNARAGATPPCNPGALNPPGPVDATRINQRQLGRQCVKSSTDPTKIIRCLFATTERNIDTLLGADRLNRYRRDHQTGRDDRALYQVAIKPFLGLPVIGALPEATAPDDPFSGRLDKAFWSDDIIQVVLPPAKDPRVVSGNEPGTNNEWMPGGYAGSPAVGYRVREALVYGRAARVWHAKFYKVFADGQFTHDKRAGVEMVYDARRGFLVPQLQWRGGYGAHLISPNDDEEEGVDEDIGRQEAAKNRLLMSEERVY